MNVFNVKCAACGALYNDIVVNGVSKLLHAGLESLADKSATPKPDCVRHRDYVLFQSCTHCCPDIFGDCPVCELADSNASKKIGIPTTKPCLCAK